MRLLIALLGALALPAPAAAATLGQVPPLELRGDIDDCQQVTGLPGEIAVDAPGGVRLVQASRTGFVAGPVVELEGVCRAVAGRASGAAVIVGTADGDIVTRVREPGGAWGVPQTIDAGGDETFFAGVAAAVSDRGDVLVVWTDDDDVFVARRAAGGAFGRAEEITAPGRVFVPGIAATGEAFLLSVQVIGTRPPVSAPVSVQIALPGQPFGAPTKVVDGSWLSTPALAVAPDGRALVASVQGDALVIAERAPGGAFAPAVPVGTAGGQFVNAGAALGADGAAAVGWQRLVEGDVVAVTRPPGGALSPAVVALRGDSLVPDGYDPFYLSESFLLALGVGTFDIEDETNDFVVLTPDGRAALTATLAARSARHVDVVSGLGTLALGGSAATQSLTVPGFSLDSDNAQPVVLPDGTPAVVWSEPLGARFRLRLAADGISERPDPPAPRLRVGKPVVDTLDERTIALPITCSAACEVRASAQGPVEAETGSLRLSRAGKGTLLIDNPDEIAPVGGGRVRIRLAYGAPGALHPRERTVTVRLEGPPALPRVTALKARRDGDAIRVTWRTRGSASGAGFFVTGDDTREWSGEPIVSRVVGNRRGSSYSVTLPSARDVRWVTVRVTRNLGTGTKTLVRVRG